MYKIPREVKFIGRKSWLSSPRRGENGKLLFSECRVLAGKDEKSSGDGQDDHYTTM